MAAWADGNDSLGDHVFEYIDAYVFAAEWAVSTPIPLLRVERCRSLFAPEL